MNISAIQEDNYYPLALQFIDGLGAIKTNHLLRHFGSAKSVFDATKKDLANLEGIHEKIIQQIISKASFEKADKELLFCEKNYIDILTINSADYPPRFKHLDDKPIVLFKKGNIHSQIKKTIAIVGTRKSTDYGHRFLDNFFDEFRGIGDVAVISGMALGIDQRAHSLSLKNKIPTVAVMGLSLEKVYPTQNTKLAKTILEENGGWLTETSSQDKTSQGVFPRRNRLIAGMSDALLVVETDISGGSIITAKLANDYNREIFALPGRINDAQSRGCNELIKNNMASLVNSPMDIIDVMSWNSISNKKVPKVLEINFEGTNEQKKVLDFIRIYPKIDFEKLLIESKLEHGKLIEILLDLELEGMINTLPGGQYELI